jgi:hypothetical protein
MHRLLNGKAEAGRSMLEDRRANAIGGLVDKKSLIEAPLVSILLGKGSAQAKASCSRMHGRCKLGNHEDEIAVISIGQIPAIGLELVTDLFDKPSGTIESERLFATDQSSQQPIETKKMVDMSMRDENVIEPIDLARR